MDILMITAANLQYLGEIYSIYLSTEVDELINMGINLANIFINSVVADEATLLYLFQEIRETWTSKTGCIKSLCFTVFNQHFSRILKRNLSFHLFTIGLFKRQLTSL